MHTRISKLHSIRNSLRQCMHAQLTKPSPITLSSIHASGSLHSSISLATLAHLLAHARSSRTLSRLRRAHALILKQNTCSPSHSHLLLSWTSRTEVEDHNLRISRGVKPTDHEGEIIRRRTQLPRLHGVHASCCRSCSCQLSSHNPSAALSAL